MQVKEECKVFEKILDRAGRTFAVFGCEAMLRSQGLFLRRGPVLQLNRMLTNKHTKAAHAENTPTHIAQGAANRLRSELETGEFSQCVKLVSLVCDWQII